MSPGRPHELGVNCGDVIYDSENTIRGSTTWKLCTGAAARRADQLWETFSRESTFDKAARPVSGK